MTIRHAENTDRGRIGELLYQVHDVHAQKRPDIFKPGQRKYSDAEIAALIADESKPFFVFEDASGVVQGYALCEWQITQDQLSLMDRKVLYLDDLCVNAACRGQQIGQKLYDHVVAFAKARQCHSLTLHVWSANEGARKFYERLGLKPLKTLLEQRLA